MRHRVLVACALLAAAVPGLLFAPVFGWWPLVPPIAAVLAGCYLVVELCVRFPLLRPWRPLLALVVGLLAVAEVELRHTTLAGLPTGGTLRALAAGVTDSWQLTLQSTWPVRPDAEVLLFVPLIVLVTAVLGIEALRWPAVAALPGVAALGLSQVFTAVTGPVATAVGLGYAVIVAGLFIASRAQPRRASVPAARGRGAAAVLVLPTVVMGVITAVAVTAVTQGRQPAYSLHQDYAAPAPLPRTVSPLAEVAARLENPDVPVFSYTGADQADRWRMVVLTDFNGVTWTAPDRYRRLGAQVDPQPVVTVPTTPRSARLTLLPGAGDGPWLPSQPMPASVTGTAPLIEPASGMLLLPDRAGSVDYALNWWEPEVNQAALAGAAVNPAAVSDGGVGVVPPGIAELARTATGGRRPSFESAMVLEQYLSQNYKVATGADLPTGSGWPQLREFLLTSKRGTSEQFAAAYVALARIVGIPARLAVGYRAPRVQTGDQVVVHNRDVLAWPEVAVTGVGWVPLDPTGTAAGAGAAASSLGAVTAQLRAALPPLPDPRNQPPAEPEVPDQPAPDPGPPFPVLPVLLGALALLVLALAGIPLLKAIRTLRRRRRSGTRGVVAAWLEARDLLRAHGTPVTPGMTVRDLATAVAPTLSGSVVDGLLRLAGRVDAALWSGAGASDGTVGEAWAAVRDIRRGLAERPWRARLRAVFDPRSLFAR